MLQNMAMKHSDPREILSDFDANGFARPNIHLQFACRSQGGMDRFKR
jgi:hypothetical protein